MIQFLQPQGLKAAQEKSHHEDGAESLQWDISSAAPEAGEGGQGQGGECGWAWAGQVARAGGLRDSMAKTETKCE